MRTTHRLKTWPLYFEEVHQGRKTFEVRVNDRDFKEGDLICLQEYLPDNEKYTGRCSWFKAGYILPVKDMPGGGDSPMVVVSLLPFTMEDRIKGIWVYDSN
jgi:hypothetical protein